MANPDAAYVPERAQVDGDELAGWTVDDLADMASGSCPACGHSTESNLQSTAVAQGPAQGEPAGGAVRFFECHCGRPHKDGNLDRLSCGRWWLATVLPQGHAPRIVPEADDSLLSAARALAQEQPEQESAIRASAEKWVAGVTALLGLFGLAGVVTAKDALTGVDRDDKIIASIFLLIAIICAAVALLQTYRAAYGIPKVVEVKTRWQLSQWFANRQQNAKKAAGRLRAGIFLALIALIALIVSVGIVRYAPAAATRPLVKVTRINGSSVCGRLLDSTRNQQLRIRDLNGDVQYVAAARMAKAINVSKCAG